MKYFLLLAMLVGCLSLHAQNNTKNTAPKKEAVSESENPSNVITVAIGLTNKVRLKYEHAFTDHISLTVTGSGYYGFFPGVLGAVGARFYLSGQQAPEGFFVSPRLHVGYFSLDTWETNNRTYEFTQSNFTTLGGGFQVGYQVLFGNRNNISLDLALGFKYLPMPSSIQFKSVYGSTDPDILQYYNDDLDGMRWIWRLTGPGSYMDGTIAFGFAF